MKNTEVDSFDQKQQLMHTSTQIGVALLTTPPFPEYTSGHSVISAAAATTLTYLYGESFSYSDTVEVKYGLTARDFNSFKEASQEAAISRLYGGIHYRPAIDNGVDQGIEVGEFIVGKLKEWNEQ